jgi:hypothetical protein
LVAQLFQMRAQMQKLMGMMQGQEAIAGMGDLVDSLNADEKVRIIASGSMNEVHPVSFAWTTFNGLNCWCILFRHLLALHGGGDGGVSHRGRGSWRQWVAPSRP